MSVAEVLLDKASTVEDLLLMGLAAAGAHGRGHIVLLLLAG